MPNSRKFVVVFLVYIYYNIVNGGKNRNSIFCNAPNVKNEWECIK